MKTELDNFARLDNQINCYYKAFKYVNVLCPERACHALLERYRDSPVGICVLTGRGVISVRKKCDEYSGALSRAAQFDLLRKAEREAILLACGFNLPAVGAGRYYRACLELFTRIPEKELDKEFLKALKSRGASIDIKALEEYPDEFKLVAYAHRASFEQACGLASFLEAPCCKA